MSPSDAGPRPLSGSTPATPDVLARHSPGSVPSAALLSAAAGDAAAVRRTAFARLRSGTAVPQERIAADVGLSSAVVGEALAGLVASGAADLDESQRVVAVGGLSVVPAAHELFMEGRAFWTWCAFDAVGIPAALGLDAVARTQCGHCGELIEVILTGGMPSARSPVVGWLPGRTCANVQADFCPEANLFCSDAHLTAWHSMAGAPPGEARALADLAALGTHVWAEMRSAPESP